MPGKLYVLCVGAIATVLSSAALAYGEEGHSIVAEVAQHRLNAPALEQVEHLLGKGVSLASIASWADDYRAAHKETSNWHFVDIPLSATNYDEARDCKSDATYGDCILRELDRLNVALRCSTNDEERRMALKFAVHFLGDLHQPLHAVGDERGGNLVHVKGTIKGNTCTTKCELDPDVDNLHSVWDTTLIRRDVYDWGAYVEHLESTWLKTNTFEEHYTGDAPLDWALQTHAVAGMVWNAKTVPPDGALSEQYFQMAVPILDQELALGGVRLARFLNSALAPKACQAVNQPSEALPGAETGLQAFSNLGEAKNQLKAYLAKGANGEQSRYEKDQAAVGEAATAWILRRAKELTDPAFVKAHGATKMALVLDIDETTLNNLAEMSANDYGYIRGLKCERTKDNPACAAPGWDLLAQAPAIASTKKLFDAARGAGVDVFFITGRDDTREERDATDANLKGQGFSGYTRLVMHTPGVPQSGASVADYKAPARAAIVLDGYTILANVGDQPSDLSGGFAEKVFLMPDPFYRIH